MTTPSFISPMLATLVGGPFDDLEAVVVGLVDPIRWRPMDLTDRLRTLADVLPVLEAPDADFGHWELPPPRDGVHALGWFEFGPTAEAWRAAVARGEWIVVGFDWQAWLAGDEGRALRDDRAAIANATPEHLARLLTAIVRSDRFVEGSIAGAFESGVLAAISRRAIGLLNDR